MNIAIITTSGRDRLKRWESAEPQLGTAVEALLQGFQYLPEHNVYVLMPIRRNPQQRWRDGNVTFQEIPVPMWGMMKSLYLGTTMNIRRKLQDIDPDIVHGQGTERECAVASVFSGFQNVLTIHGNMRAIARNMNAPVGSFHWTAAMLERFTLPRTLGVLCNSKYTESMVRPIARRTWQVPNAIRREFFETPLPVASFSQIPVLLNVGTISPHKRQLELLDIGKELVSGGDAFEIHFIGEANPQSEYAAEFLSRIKRPDYSGFARHIDVISSQELIAAFDNSAALIHLASEEAFGLVVAEALARNLKFFGTQIGGVHDIARDVEGAELFRLEDRRAVSVAIANWFKQGCPRPTTAANEMRTRYFPKVIADQHVEIYNEVLDG